MSGNFDYCNHAPEYRIWGSPHLRCLEVEGAVSTTHEALQKDAAAAERTAARLLKGQEQTLQASLQESARKTSADRVLPIGPAGVLLW